MNTTHRDRSFGFLRGLVAIAAITTLGVLQGCQIFGVASVIGQNIEREKKIEVLAEYDGLRNQTVASVPYR